MPLGQPARDRARGVELDAVALAVIDRQRGYREPRLARDPGADHRIEPARQQNDRALHSLMPILGAAQNISA